MTSTSAFESLEAAIADECFPEVDLALRRGRHLGLEDGALYQYIDDAQDYLEPFYRRFGCELVRKSEGYFYLLPSGERLRRRRLSSGEMLVGQTLALMHLDPSSVQHRGVVSRGTLLQRLEGLLGVETLARILDPRRRKFDERIIAESIRKKVAEALRRLADLGFIDILDETSLRLRPALMRFAEPVRGLSDLSAALERLVASGEIDVDDVEGEGEGDSGDSEGSGEPGDPKRADESGAPDPEAGIPDDDAYREDENPPPAADQETGR